MNTHKKIITLSISAAIALTSTSSAFADGHEIKMLRDQIKALTQRLDQLEQESAEHKQTVDKMASTHKNSITSGNDRVRVTVSGHVNRALMHVDDGDRSEVFHVDNDASSTRLRVIGEAEVSDELTVGAAMEMQFESNSSASVNQLDGTSVGNDNFTQRRLEVYFDNKSLGKLWMGQGWTASEGTSEVDLSGTDLAGYSDTSVVGGAVLFRNSSGTLSGVSVGDAFANFDGRGRADRLRYDTPSFNGFKFSVSAIEGDAWDAAVRYAATYDSLKVAGALAYSEPDSTTVESQVNGSVSVMLNNGFNFTFAAGERDLKSSATDPEFYYGKFGYQTRMNDAGTTSFSVDYHRSDDLDLMGDEGTAYGLQAVQKFDAWSTEGYIGWRTYELDRSGSSFKDIDAIITGARVKF